MPPSGPPSEIAAGRTIAAVASAQVAAWVEGASRSLAVLPLEDGRGRAALARRRSGRAWRCSIASAIVPQPPQAERPAPPDPREAIRREMLQLKGTWSSMQTVESTINGVPQQPKTVQDDLVDRSRLDHRHRR